MNLQLPKLKESSRRVGTAELGREPYRLFFPAAMLAGMLGVLLWPLYFFEAIGFYPGQAHARMMTFGFFGGFIFGFLGTAMPRMLSAQALGSRNVITLLGLYLLMVSGFAAGKVALGDAVLAGLLLTFLFLMGRRFRQRQDIPPPGFVLVGLSFLCVIVASGLALWQHFAPQTHPFWFTLQRSLAYQGFVLLPVLGIAPFILPRFFGMPSPHDFPEMMSASRVWKQKAFRALAAGLLIVASFLIEAAGQHGLAYAIRFVVVAGYLYLEIPFGTARGNIFAISLRIGLALVPAGFLAVMLLPNYRISFLHLTLMGGIALITLTVATRVVFGHSGNLPRLKERNRWAAWGVGLLLLGVATRISGDFWPKILISHYNYAALIWVCVLLIWAWKFVPKFWQCEPED